MEPHIIFEDDDLLVINKPAGMIVNRADTTKDEVTLQEWVETRTAVIPASEPESTKGDPDFHQDDKGEIGRIDTYNAEEVFGSRAGIVHRLDKETSGVILVAKNVEAFVNLQAQFKERKTEKTYLALVHGLVEPEEGEINAPVGRLPWNRMRFGVLADGREAVTKYKILRYYDTKILGNEKLSLVELYPKTGRTHQIRVHLKHINHPIFGDLLYAGRKTSRDDRLHLPRVFLHASKISFTHPKSAERMTMEAPLASELQAFLETLLKK